MEFYKIDSRNYDRAIIGFLSILDFHILVSFFLQSTFSLIELEREIQQNEEQVFGLEAVMSPGQENSLTVQSSSANTSSILQHLFHFLVLFLYNFNIIFISY